MAKRRALKVQYRAALCPWPATMSDFLNILLQNDDRCGLVHGAASGGSSELIQALADCGAHLMTKCTSVDGLPSTGELGVWIDNLRDPFGRSVMHACAHYDTAEARRLRTVLVEKCAADPDVTYSGIRPSELQKVTKDAEAALERGLEMGGTREFET